MIPIDDDTFNNMVFEPVKADMVALDKKLAGYIVAGIEPIDAPLTDAINIYFKNPATDEIFVLAVGLNDFPLEENNFYCALAQYR